MVGLDPTIHEFQRAILIAYVQTRDGVDGPRTASMCQNEVVVDLIRRRPSMEKLIRIGMDTSKSVFQLHGVDASEQPALKKRLRRGQVVPFFSKLAPTVVGIEACGSAHYWARVLTE